MKDDIIFIKKCLATIPYNERRRHLERYSELWLQGIGMTDIVYQKQNLGRFMANTYLREMST